MTAKPTASELGIDLAAQVWQRSGRGDGAIEVAFVRTGDSAEWVLMRVTGDRDQRVLVSVAPDMGGEPISAAGPATHGAATPPA